MKKLILVLHALVVRRLVKHYVKAIMDSKPNTPKNRLIRWAWRKL